MLYRFVIMSKTWTYDFSCKKKSILPKMDIRPFVFVVAIYIFMLDKIKMIDFVIYPMKNVYFVFGSELNLGTFGVRPSQPGNIQAPPKQVGPPRNTPAPRYFKQKKTCSHPQISGGGVIQWNSSTFSAFFVNIVQF